MLYFVGQALGLLGACCGLVLPLMKQKSQMLIMTMITNGLTALNLLLIGRFGSAVLIHAVAVAQALVTLLHLRQNRSDSRWNALVFLLLYLVCGFLSFTGLIDLLPIIGSLFNMAATFQRDVQKTRYLILVNVSFFLVYYVLVGSASALMPLGIAITTLAALLRQRKGAFHEL